MTPKAKPKQALQEHARWWFPNQKHVVDRYGYSSPQHDLWAGTHHRITLEDILKNSPSMHELCLIKAETLNSLQHF